MKICMKFGNIMLILFTLQIFLLTPVNITPPGHQSYLQEVWLNRITERKLDKQPFEVKCKLKLMQVTSLLSCKASCFKDHGRTPTFFKIVSSSQGTAFIYLTSLLRKKSAGLGLLYMERLLYMEELHLTYKHTKKKEENMPDIMMTIIECENVHDTSQITEFIATQNCLKHLI